MLTVGLTGGIGSGKTSVSVLFKKLGIPIIDTDVISRELVNNNQSVQQELIETFGDNIIADSGNISRKRLAQIVFNDVPEKQKLEIILHPRIRAEVMIQLQKYNSQITPPQYVIIVVPLLFETNFRDFIDRILVISADEKIRIERIMQRDNRGIEEIQSIIASQVTENIRISEADDVLVNNDKFGELVPQVQELHTKYTNLSNLSN